MAYVPTKWENIPSTSTPLDADNLNKLEQGVESAHDSLASKLDKSAVVQTTGQSTTSMMSQDAATKTFQPKGSYALTGASYTKAESDAKYQEKGDYEEAGTSYTKAESDGKYQVKGNYSLTGASYTKAESDAKYQLKGETVEFDVESLTEDDIAALKLKLGIS